MEKSIVDLEEFEKVFGTEDQCLDYLFNLRWSNGYRCPRCQWIEAWEVQPHKYKCRRCGYQTTVTSGTLFHHTHIPMTVWFKAARYMLVNYGHVRLEGLQKELGLGSNRTALAIREKLNSVMYCSIPDKLDIWNNPLSGTVEAGIMFIRFDKRRINIDNKLDHLFIAVEVRKKGIGRIYIEPIERDDYAMLATIIGFCVSPGSTVQIKGFKYDSEIFDNLYIIKKKRVEYSYPYLNKVLYVFSNWMATEYKTGTLLGAARQYCEFVNRRKTPPTFDELLRNAVSVEQW